MRRLFAAALLVVAASTTSLAEAPAGRVIDLEFRIIGLELRTESLELDDSDVAGAIAELEVEETETEIRIELSADVLFDFDKSDIRQEAAAALKQVATMIRDQAGRPVRIEGHTDSKGSEDYNQRLSEDRALSVKEWLIEVEGLDGGGFETIGFGESSPAAANEKPDGSDDPDGRQKNRRVEIVIGK